MELSESQFWVLDALDSHEVTTQRQLSKHAGLSLGHVNYVLRSLIEKGMVKTGNFQRNPRKNRYIYLLTPKGLEAKSRLAVKFVIALLNEYDGLRRKMIKRLTMIENQGHSRLIFVGPPTVKDLMESLIKEEGLNLTLVGHQNQWIDLKGSLPRSFDAVVLFDGNSEGAKRITEETGIAIDRLLPLW